MYRSRVYSSRKDHRFFRRTASRTHSMNLTAKTMRGGIRL